MKTHQQPHTEDSRRERANDTDVAPNAAKRSASLGSSLRACMRQVTGARMLEPNVLHKLEERALDAVTARSQDAASSLSGRFSRMYGASLRHISLLRDVNLRRDRGDPALESSKELRRAAQELRRSFNRMSFSSTSDISTADLSGLLKRLEERIEASSSSKRGLTPLTRNLADATRVLALRGSSIPWGDARELVVRVLGAVRGITSRHHHNADDAHQGRAVPPEALHRLEALLPLTTSSAHHATDIATPSPPARADDRSVPLKFINAARRSLCGTQLGFIQALESACAQFEKNPSSRTLEPITSVIDSWRRGELGNVGLFSGTNTEPLTQELQRDAALPSHSIVREILSPLIEWSATHYNHLPPASVEHLTKIVAAGVSVLRNAAITEMLKSPDGVTFEQEGAHTKLAGAHAFQGTRKSPTQELLLGNRLGAFNLFGPTITDVSNHFILEPSSVTPRELNYLAQAARWARKVSTQTVEATIPIRSSAVWISEFDGGQGATIPKEIAEQFTEMQQKLQVKPDSTKSGFVYPEDEDWLHQHIHQHDGFLLVMQEGSLQGSLNNQAVRALFVATCDQADPSPLMKKIEKHAAGYLDELPRGSYGAHPRMVCELALSAPEAALFLRKYGEHAYSALDRQFRYNTISRFPTAERVECFATCREGSTAMNAHERMGWKKTGSTYVDEHGTRFDILHNVIFPAATVLGYRDIQ